MNGRVLIAMVCAVLALAVAGCGGDDDSTSASTEATTEATTTETTESPAPDAGSQNLNKKPEVTVPGGAPPKQLETEDLVVGKGPEARPGDEVTVQYVGVGYDSEEEFDASWDRGEPFSFLLGGGEVIKGWDQGIVGMKVGGRRELTIPPNLAYGPTGSPPAIGPNETLIFVVDLVDVP
ncbi:MAG TPA: FKBP-type peptidyl-prolyl cis-trans isomerase [Solirubrobacterales bacterium]|nr:FKBP-type peptidyl-prolyl cis-trans isomerase [Solirubrobacterales bacterium]